jgi:hypothetical protein
MQDRKRRRTQPAMELFDDNLSTVLEFLPVKDHPNFTLVSKQFQRVFCSSHYGAAILILMEVKNRLSGLQGQNKLEFLHILGKKIKSLEPIVRGEVENKNIYERMGKKFGNEVVKFEQFLFSVKVININMEYADVGEGARTHSVLMDCSGTEISLQFDNQGDHARSERMSVDIGGKNVVYYSADDNDSDMSFNKKPLKSLPYKFSNKEWFKLFLLLTDFFIEGSSFRHWPSEDEIDNASMY